RTCSGSDRRRMRGYVTFPIIIVLTAIGYLYYTTLFVLIDGWLGLSTAAGFANAAVFTALAVVVVVTYGIAVFKDPGRVPYSFSPDIEHSESPIHEIKRKVWIPLLLCDMNSLSWIGYLHVNNLWDSATPLNYCINCPFGLAYLPHPTKQDHNRGLVLNKYRLSISCLTTVNNSLYYFCALQYHEGVKAMWLAEKVGNVYRHPYDLGIYENLKWVRTFCYLATVLLCW
ncbi:hypothetical protein BHE74_00047831, partial [Ensete ventricosum]